MPTAVGKRTQIDGGGGGGGSVPKLQLPSRGGALDAAYASGPFTPAVNNALGASFGSSALSGLTVTRNADAATSAIGAHAVTHGSHIALSSSIKEDVKDPRSMKIIGHEVSHALAGGGSGETMLDQPGDTGESAAHAAGDAFEKYAADPSAGAPKLGPAHGGRASLHRFQIEGSVVGVNNPVHETLTQETLKAAGLTSEKTKYSDPAAWEYTRGTMWNDDPKNQLFDDKKDGPTNNYSYGVEWLREFKNAEKEVNKGRKYGVGDSLLERNQGDLQALHGMAGADGEDPQLTKGKMMMWAEFTTKVSKGEISGDAKIGEIELSNPLFKKLIGADPLHKDKTVNQFFGIQGKGADLKKRTQGSMLHMIQDSYAGGHTEREDLGGGRMGAIKNFHAYEDQDHGKHDAADLPIDKGKKAPGLTQQVHTMPGGQDAIDQGAIVLKMIKAGVPTEKILEHLDTVTFKTDANIGPATPGDHFQREESKAKAEPPAAAPGKLDVLRERLAKLGIPWMGGDKH